MIVRASTYFKTTSLAVGAWLGLSFPLGAQVGGSEAFTALLVPDNAYAAALGGRTVSGTTRDASLLWSNPALTDSAHKQMGLNYMNYPGDIWMTNLTGSWLTRNGTWSAGLKYLDLGKAPATDPSGASLGEFHATDYALSLGYARSLGPFQMGLTLSYFRSDIADFGASALMVDIGGAFIHPRQDLVVGMVFRNLGSVFRDYSATAVSSLPFDLQIGATYKPEYMPFRFSLTLHHLTTSALNYTLVTRNTITNVEALSTLDRIFRHVTLGLEIVLHRNVQVFAGFDHLRRQELRLEQTSGGAGLSTGFRLRIKAFSMTYAWMGYHTAGANNTLGLMIDINAWGGRRITIK